MSIYTDMQEAGLEIDHNESDLYVRSTLDAWAILRRYPEARPTRFRTRGQQWIDIPFHYDPYWEAKQAQPPMILRGKLARLAS